MKAVQITGVKNIEIVDIPEPVLKEGQAEIAVKAMGVCGSDVHAYAGKSPNVTYPVIIGHETAGIVTHIAPNADNPNGIRTGDRVVLNPYIYCGACYPCSQGRTNCCERLKCLGVQTDGSMSERFAHPLSLMVKVPENIDWETCAVIEPSVIALHALHTLKMKSGEHIVVVGAGCIGMLVGILAMVKGGIPILVDVVEQRLELARSFGIPYTVNSMTQDSVSVIREITGGRMAECVSEASGSASGIRNTLDYAAYTGRIALTGWPNRDISLPTALITRKEMEIRGSRTGVTSEFQEVLEMAASGKLNIRQIISRVVSLEQLPAAIQHLDEHPSDDLKVIALNL